MIQRKICRTALAALLAGAAGILWAANAPVPEPVQRAAESITRSTIEAPIRFLASDLLEGRGPATRGDALAQLYLATQLEDLGYEPGAGDGSYRQPFDIVGVEAQVPETWSFEAQGQQVDLKWAADFIAASGVQSAQAAVEDSELVFVGYGIVAPEYRWDDFKGADLKGKMLLMLNNDPDWDPELFEGKRRLLYGRWTYKYESAARQGAAGAIIIHTTPSAGYPWQVVETSWSGKQFALPAHGEPRIQVAAWTTEAATRRLLAAVGQDLDKLVEAAHSRDFRPVPLGLRTSIHLENELEHAQTANVAGLLRGSDPKLAEQVVVYTAHHDHLGMAPAKSGGTAKQVDRIYNGAIDNASGCAQVLAIARAFKALPEPPRRSTLILFVAAEEQGLLGSQYYAEHPTFAAGKIAANINIDGGNDLGRTRDIQLVGSGKSSLDAVAESVIRWQGRVLTPDQFPDRGHFYRSDQFNFARIGVPALYFDLGTDFVGRPAGWGRAQIEAWVNEHYHQPSDEIDDSWNFDGMIEDARMMFETGWLVSQADAMPTWNPGDEFEPARKRALAAVTAQP